MSGVLDAFSAGVLIYTGLVEVRGFYCFWFFFVVFSYSYSFSSFSSSCPIRETNHHSTTAPRTRLSVQPRHDPTRFQHRARVRSWVCHARLWIDGVAWSMGIVFFVSLPLSLSPASPRRPQWLLDITSPPFYCMTSPLQTGHLP